MKNALFVSLLGSLLLTACSKETGESFTDEVKHIVISAQDFKYEADSRTNLDITSSGAVFSWAEKDRDNSNAHSVYVYIMLKGQPMLYPCMLYMYQCENIVSSFIFPRCLAIPDVDEQDKSHTFFVYIR